ncbi:MAG: uroporphyrinogen decarboxylase/cobalamine-independent methonine synthase family protein [Chloroflexota bacterium]
MSDSTFPLPNVERLRAFWAREDTDRPLLATWVGSYAFPDLYPVGLAKLPEGELKPADVRCEFFREDYENLFAAHAAATVDVPWSAYPLGVLPWAEALSGCRIVHRAGNIWSEPWVDDYTQLGSSMPHKGWLAKLKEFIVWLVELSAGRFPVAVSLLRGPADLLAAVRGAERCILDLVDTPEAVDRALDLLTEVWLVAARSQMERIPAFHGGWGWNIQNLWSEQPGAWFQDDAIAFWSPPLYRTHAFPRERRLSEAFPATGCHLHSASIFTVDELLKMPALGVVEMNLDVSGLTIAEMIPAFQRVLKSQRLYVWGHFSHEDLTLMRAQLPARGLALQLMAETPDAVRAMIRDTEALWAK